MEDRQLLSAVVSGVDANGDQWTLKLLGPGSLSVTKQPDATTGAATSLTDKTNIDTITLGGTNPITSRLISHVTPAAGSDGRVLFQNLTVLPNTSDQQGNGLGPLSIDIPQFWLANTQPAPTGTSTSPPTPTISIPDGVNTLRFGGVDTTINQNTTTTGENYLVALGLPEYGGTRVIIDKSISSQTTNPPASGTQETVSQNAVLFAVAGRLNLFQANSIEGDANVPPGQFQNNNVKATGFGGTWVVSGTPNTGSFGSPFFVNPLQRGAVTGQIGDLRVGGNATNFSTLVFDGTGSGNAKVTNYSIGGETNNVLLVAPNGSRNVSFGTGMDTVAILSHVINKLQANRGAVNSQVYVDRSISQVMIGGDVNDTVVDTGVQQNYSSIFNAVTGQSSSIFATTTVSPPPQPLNAQNGGGMSVVIGGNVTDSFFAASTEPGGTYTTVAGGTVPVFGTSQDLVLPTGHIRAKVEGNITNSQNDTGKSFFAQSVTLKKGPVVPPNVPQPPYNGAQTYIGLPGISKHTNPGNFKTRTSR